MELQGGTSGENPGTSRPGFMQDQDQDLLVHQDQDQDQGLAQA